MSKKKLDVEIGVEAAVIGVVSSLKDYKLAWKINQVFKIELILDEDLVISMANNTNVIVSNYCYQTDFLKINLIRNKGMDQTKATYLVPELPQIDFFMLITGEEFFMDVEEAVSKLKELEGVSFVQLIDISKLKSKDNFIF